MDGKSWKLVELNCRWGEVDDPCATFTSVPTRVLTLVSEEPLTRAWIDMSDEGMQQYVQTGSVEVGPDQDQEPAMPEVHNAESGADEAQQRAAEESSHAGDGIPVQPMQLVGVPILEPNRVVIDSEEFSASSTLNELRRAARKLGLSAGGSKSKVWSRLVEFEAKRSG